MYGDDGDEELTTWRKLIQSVMAKDFLDGGEADSFDNVVDMLPSDLDLDREFDNDYGSEKGIPFVLWTKQYVYFPTCYDGAEWVSRVPRNPTAKFNPSHFGGG